MKDKNPNPPRVAGSSDLETLSITTAAQLLGVSRTTMAHYANMPGFPKLPGARGRIPRKALLDWVMRQANS